MARRFWQEFGVAQPPLSRWPHHKVVRYTQIMRVEDEVAAERRRESEAAQATDPAAVGRPASTERARATEDAFQRMREIALAEATAAKQPTPPTT